MRSDEPGAGEVEAYRRHSAVTRPGPHAAVLRALPDDVQALVPLVRNVLIHHTRAEGFVPGRGAPDDGTELRPVRALLDAVQGLDDRSWTEPREPGRRLVVDCRSLAVLLCAVLREHARPARVRFGFASYLTGTHWQSHVVCEHLDAGGRWIRTDPDTGRFALRDDEFLDAGQAWRSGPAGEDLPSFGYAPDLRGRWAVRWELQRDLAALTGFEPLTSDVWGLAAQVPGDSPDGGRRDLFDRVAAATTLAERRAVADDPAFAVPPVITAAPYLTGRSYPVDLVAEGSLHLT